jgi:hypothetical protein
MNQKDIREALRTRLLDNKDKPAEVKGVVVRREEKKEDPLAENQKLANLFRLRYENLTTVTYRKHIIVLLEQTLIPGLIFLILFLVAGFEIFSSSLKFSRVFHLNTGQFIVIWAGLLIASILWWIYQYIDWSNDIFQVSPDQIMDIDRTPLGQVSSDVAPLENILSIEYRRKGILEVFFNYGKVFITIGGGREMVFEDVFNPSTVQEDIERRRLEKINKKEQDKVNAERQRVSDWFAAYYENEDQIRQEQGSTGEQKNKADASKNEVK